MLFYTVFRHFLFLVSTLLSHTTNVCPSCRQRYRGREREREGLIMLFYTVFRHFLFLVSNLLSHTINVCPSCRQKDRERERPCFWLLGRYSDSIGLDGPGIESRWEARFSELVQTGPETHPASYTMGTGSFLGVKRPGRGVDHLRLASRFKKE